MNQKQLRTELGKAARFLAGKDQDRASQQNGIG